jgi:hypothetical protein
MWMRKVVLGAALAALLLTSGCCWPRCCHRKFCRDRCGCDTCSAYRPPACDCGAPTPGPIYTPAPTGPMMPPAKPN